MKARYVNLSAAELAPHPVQSNWDTTYRGKTVNIDPRPIPRSAVANAICDGPFFELLPHEREADGYYSCECIHVLELDESSLGREVEAVFAEMVAGNRMVAR